MKRVSLKSWFCLGLFATIVLIVISQSDWPTAEEAAQERCMTTYGSRDWDVVESLSSTSSSAIRNIPCSDQHLVLNQLADVPKGQRNEWLDRLTQTRHQSFPASSATEK
jgi:hypothetical protein